MCKFLNETLDNFRRYNIFDIAVFKILLLVLGALFGAACADKVKNSLPVLIPIMIFSYIWVMFRTFGSFLKKKS